MKKNKIYHGDCLEVMKRIKDKSIDMILCDLPYGLTQCKWDSEINLDQLWKHYNRIIKDSGAIVLTASQPFTTKLIMSNIEKFKYEIIWYKSKPSNFMNAKKQILKQHENILVFYKKQCTYSPQKTFNNKAMNTRYFSGGYQANDRSVNPNKVMKVIKQNSTERYPISVIKINDVIGNSKEKKSGEHPTQKPVALFEYLIKTYTNELDTVLDNCIGSGTTAIAAINCNCNFIGIEKEIKYVEIARKRIQDHIDNR
jgi:site-specific DNA-methyltransferase (adenine-specific)